MVRQSLSKLKDHGELQKEHGKQLSAAQDTLLNQLNQLGATSKELLVDIGALKAQLNVLNTETATQAEQMLQHAVQIHFLGVHLASSS